MKSFQRYYEYQPVLISDSAQRSQCMENLFTEAVAHRKRAYIFDESAATPLIFISQQQARNLT